MELSDKDIIKKYIAGNCTGQEIARVRSIMARPDYNGLVDEVLSAQGNPVQANLDGEDEPQMRAWTEKISGRIAQDADRSNQRSLRKPFFFRYAAIWIVLAMSAGMWGVTQFRKSKQQPQAIAYMVKFNPSGKRTKLILPDSSVIVLGSESRLHYPERFAGTTREVSLEGEAFFEITKNPEKPFIIHTGEIQTKVLGTSFKITAFKDRPLSVSVATGKVRVDRFSGQQVESLAVLIPGQQVLYSQGKASTTGIEIDELTEWKEGHLVHIGRPLKEIAEELERWYAVKITVANAKLAKMPMDINITANIPIDRVMNVLSVSGGFKYTITGNNIRIH